MSTFVQFGAFQDNAFQRTQPDITDTDAIQYPIDYVLLGHQKYMGKYSVNDVRPPEIRYSSSKLMRRG